MIKYIGGALLIAVGWIMGQSINGIYKERVKVIERFRNFVAFCESEISFFKTEMCSVIDKFREEGNKYDDLIFDPDKKSFLRSKGTTKAISDFFSQITLLDAENQKYFFADTKNKIQQILETGQKDVELKGQMAKKLLPILAIGIFILTL